MSYLMLHEQASAFGLGDVLYFLAVWWGIFTVLLNNGNYQPGIRWQVWPIWSALIYLPIYILFIPKTFSKRPVHLLVQVVFHGVLVVNYYLEPMLPAIERFGF